MKTIASVLTCFTFCFTSSLFGQEAVISQPKKFTLNDISIQPGIFTEQNTNPAIADFALLAPRSILLTNDFSGFNSSSGRHGNSGYSFPGNNSYPGPGPYGMGNSSSPMASILLGIKINKKEGSPYKSNPLLRLGFSYFSGNGLTENLFKEERKTYDEITSDQTGQTVFLDSVTTQSYYMNYSAQQVRFDGSILFRTNTTKRWSLYSGIGFTAGFSINASTKIHYTRNDRADAHFANETDSDQGHYSGPSGSEHTTTETFKNTNNFGASAYIPFGIDFRLGKKRELWKQLHLFYEARPGINMTSIPELSTVTSASLQHGIGIKYSLD